MKNYAKGLNRPLDRDDLIKNDAGGWGFELSPREKLSRFIAVGDVNGTYYVDYEANLSRSFDNIKNHFLSSEAEMLFFLSEVKRSLEEGFAMRINTTLFSLAVLCSNQNKFPAIKKQALALIPTLRTPTQLFYFLKTLKSFSGWNRSLRRAVASWYTQHEYSVGDLIYKVLKYRQREGYTHADVIKLCHLKSSVKRFNNLIKYVLLSNKSNVSLEELSKILDQEPSLKAFSILSTCSDEQLVEIVEKHKFSWEMIPTDRLNNQKVLKAILPNLQPVALMRNLNRYAYNDITTQAVSNEVDYICSVFTDKEKMKMANIHPIILANNIKTYSQGTGNLGNKTWTANSKILEAMEDAYYNSFDYLPKINKKILVAVDESGSMNSSCSNTCLLMSTVAKMIAVTLMRQCSKIDSIAFTSERNINDLQNLKLNKHSSLIDILKSPSNGGGTDCSLPIRFMLEKKLKYDAVVIITDSETWAEKGNERHYSLLHKYRASVNKDIKVIEIGLDENFSIQPPEDKNCYRINGFDANVMNYVSDIIA